MKSLDHYIQCTWLMETRRHINIWKHKRVKRVWICEHYKSSVCRVESVFGLIRRNSHPKLTLVAYSVCTWHHYALHINYLDLFTVFLNSLFYYSFAVINTLQMECTVLKSYCISRCTHKHCGIIITFPCYESCLMKSMSTKMRR